MKTYSIAFLTLPEEADPYVIIRSAGYLHITQWAFQTLFSYTSKSEKLVWVLCLFTSMPKGRGRGRDPLRL